MPLASADFPDAPGLSMTPPPPRGSSFNPVILLLAACVCVSSLLLLTTPFYYLAWAPAAGMLLLLLLGQKPEVGFYLILFLVPWDSVRAIVSQESPITISKIVGVGLLIVLFFHIVFSKRIGFNLSSNLWRWIGLFLLTALVTCLLSDFPLESWGDFRQLLTSVIIFALGMAFIHDRGFTRTVPRIVIFSIGVGTFISVTFFILGSERFAIDEGFKRLVGVARNPNHYASFVLFSMPFLAHWFFNATRNSVRFMACFIFALNLVALVLTYSRGAFIVGSVVFVALALEHGRFLRPKHLGFLLMGLAISVLVAYMYLPQEYVHRQTSISTKDSSVSSRLSYVTTAFESFWENPVIGTGLGTFNHIYSYSRFAFTEGWGRRTREDAQRDAHNTYLEVLVGMGSIGIILFLSLVVLAWMNFARAKEMSKALNDPKFTQLIGAYRLAFFSILCYFCLLSRPYSHYFWASLALSSVAVRVVQARLAAQAKEQAALAPEATEEAPEPTRSPPVHAPVAG